MVAAGAAIGFPASTRTSNCSSVAFSGTVTPHLFSRAIILILSMMFWFLLFVCLPAPCGAELAAVPFWGAAGTDCGERITFKAESFWRAELSHSALKLFFASPSISSSTNPASRASWPVSKVPCPFVPFIKPSISSGSDSDCSAYIFAICPSVLSSWVIASCKSSRFPNGAAIARCMKIWEFLKARVLSAGMHHEAVEAATPMMV